MTEITCEIPAPPSANQCWRMVNNRLILSKAYRDWSKEASLIFSQHLPQKEDWNYWKIFIDLFIFYKVKPRRIDLDNRLKPLIDMFSKSLEVDDCLLDEIHALKRFIKGEGRNYCLVRIILN